MTKILMAIIALGLSGAAMADGFVCNTHDSRYTFRIYNHTDPRQGTRNGAMMIISDNAIQYGRRTIATFSSENTLSDEQGSGYLADVDPRCTGTGRGGENFLGTKLEYVSDIRLDVDFSYRSPVEDGAPLEGRVIVYKRNGEKIRATLACTRYLKH